MSCDIAIRLSGNLGAFIARAGRKHGCLKNIPNIFIRDRLAGIRRHAAACLHCRKNIHQSMFPAGGVRTAYCWRQVRQCATRLFFPCSYCHSLSMRAPCCSGHVLHGEHTTKTWEKISEGALNSADRKMRPGVCAFPFMLPGKRLRGDGAFFPAFSRSGQESRPQPCTDPQEWVVPLPPVYTDSEPEDDFPEWAHDVRGQ